MEFRSHYNNIDNSNVSIHKEPQAPPGHNLVTYEKMFYIPFIALVPKDYNPPVTSPVTTIPVYNSQLKRVSIKHFRKIEHHTTDEATPTPKRKRVCLRWKLKIRLDQNGTMAHDRECAFWKWISLEQEKTILEQKDSSLLNSMGSMKWLVKGITGGILS